ncbi:uncharacterized protein LOC114362841 isoform X2 [Ostrinia furnacalis]|uniref:uncharacterized protein LOC114362841 isoform X2 n=1 Tax=Ostrinia furnacalis TaxID=93504 RepID=UPI00103DCBC1|nr:uncharacterized protein LOC114362841 isoform X2 [Ostrinia furnacalis]
MRKRRAYGRDAPAASPSPSQSVIEHGRIAVRHRRTRDVRNLIKLQICNRVLVNPATGVHVHLHLLRLPTTPCMVTTAETTTWVFNPAELPAVSDGPCAHSKWPYTTVRTALTIWRVGDSAGLPPAKNQPTSTSTLARTVV